MGLLIKKYVDKDVLLGLWDITENYDILLNSLSLDENDFTKLNSFKNLNRKLEWLSVRRLLYELTRSNNKIIYNSENKPFLSNNTYNISISHSKNFTSILLSKTKRVGIDLEFMSHRINKIEHKFINENEHITKNPDLLKYHLYIYWCAKEALYKLNDKQDINFKDNITIESFEPTVCGQVKGKVHTQNINEEFDLNYFRLNNYIIAWCCK
ncbi:MAG: 4'-phosphopantetheinyl transferase superfamily protein [Bacteroidales bacterium]|nr:4'-phosphopantetheinyl transferase superfamily protein [Bacteroidales bacterium]